MAGPNCGHSLWLYGRSSQPFDRHFGQHYVDGHSFIRQISMYIDYGRNSTTNRIHVWTAAVLWASDCPCTYVSASRLHGNCILPTLVLETSLDSCLLCM